MSIKYKIPLVLIFSQGHILQRISMYQLRCHKRSITSRLKEKLSQEQLDAITDFILSFKSKKD